MRDRIIPEAYSNIEKRNTDERRSPVAGLLSAYRDRFELFINNDTLSDP
jgi:hypothetical protein